MSGPESKPAKRGRVTLDLADYNDLVYANARLELELAETDARCSEAQERIADLTRRLEAQVRVARESSAASRIFHAIATRPDDDDSDDDDS